MSTPSVKKTIVRRWDWLSAILLVIIMQIAAARLAATLWTNHLDLVEFITLLGSLLGLLLGTSVFRRFWVAFFAIAYGIILIPWQLGLTLDPDYAWNERLIILWDRLETVVQELLTRKPITDSILFLLLMAMLFWAITIYSGFVLIRENNPWKVIIPGGVTAFVIHSFDPLLVSRSWYLAFYLFFALILVARLVYLKNTVKWRQNHTHTPPDLGFDLSRVALVLSMILVFFAWNVPVLADTFRPAAEIWQSASKPWLSAKDRASYIFASLRASVGLVENYYGPTLPLGLGNPLSDQVVMEVEAPTNAPNGSRFYWEARTYDTYQANQWLTSLTTTHDLTPNTIDLIQPGIDARTEVTVTFFPFVPISNLFTVPEPLWVSVPAQAYLAENPDGTVNFSAMVTRGIVHPGEQYTVRAAIDSVSVLQLKNAGTDYPQWVLSDYLQLPANITPRTKALAQSIAAGLTNPFDIASAVTQYLRSNIEYNQSVSKPPADQERIDWFLFDYKQGYCLYYASAEVVLLRSLGIPARMAVGYAQGQRETSSAQQLPSGASVDITQLQANETSTYVVRQKDAHAWPEVYFPDIGWVIFEPTASQPVLIRPSGETSTTPPTSRNLPQEDLGARELPPDRLGLTNNTNNASSGTSTNFWTLANIIQLIIFLFALAILAFVILQVRRGFKLRPFLERVSLDVPIALDKGLRRLGIRPPDFLVNWIYYRQLPPIARSYLEINRALDRIGKPPAIQDTPSERAHALVTAIPSAYQPTRKLSHEYQTLIFSTHPANSEQAEKAGIEIRKLSWRVWWDRLLARFKGPNQPG